MSFAARAALLTRLGALRQKGALKDEQFDRLKGGVLNDEGSITESILVTLDDFWGLRCNGTLDDSEYRDQLKGILGSLAADVDLDGAANASSSAPVAPSLLQAQGEHERSVANGQSGAGDGSEFAAPESSGGSSGNSGNSGSSSSSSSSSSSGGGGGGGGGSPAAESITVDAEQSGGGGSSSTPSSSSPSAGEKRKLAMQPPAADDRDGFVRVEACTRNGVKDEASEGVTLHFWRATDEFHFPGKGFASADGMVGSFVDTTAALLQTSEARAFPKFTEGVGRERADTQRLYRQRKMYVVLKKLLVCEGELGEKLVFRATREEIEKVVPEVSEGKISTDEYMHAVLKHVADSGAMSSKEA